MKILSVFKKTEIDLFFYFFKGARIDGALQFTNKLRSPTLRAYPKPDAEKIIENDKHIGYNAEDLIREFKIETGANLIIKNNSKNYAYNLILKNANELFDEYKKLDKLISVSPNERIEIPVKFIECYWVKDGNEADLKPLIPDRVYNKILLIEYENESGKKFLTKYWIALEQSYNEYTYN